jgi:hypothetical protein
MLSFVIRTSWLSLQQNVRIISCEADAIGVLENLLPLKEAELALLLRTFSALLSAPQSTARTAATRFGFSCVI